MSLDHDQPTHARARRTTTRADAALATLERPGRLYQAGIPGYASNFSRDSFVYGLLADDTGALRAQLEFSAQHQGRAADPTTGEEPGKIHHELPGAQRGTLATTYNACDTTALFLQAIAYLAKRGGHDVVGRYRANIDRALDYVFEHLHGDVFYEDTRQSGGERFALKVTYWKDSELNLAGPEREPPYPVSYALVHFQYKAALQAIGALTGSTDLLDRAAAMTSRGLKMFWRGDHFAVAISGKETIADAASSDSLHAVLYLHPDEIEPADAVSIVTNSERLATRFGYLPALPESSEVDPYHTRYVWVHEQALLHAAARRHRLTRAEHVARRVTPIFAHGFPELVDPVDGSTGAGNVTQLWAIGAHRYFQRIPVAATRSPASALRQTEQGE